VQKRLTFSLILELLAVASIHMLHAEMHVLTKGKGEGTHPSNSQTGHRGRDWARRNTENWKHLAFAHPSSKVP